MTQCCYQQQENLFCLLNSSTFPLQCYAQKYRLIWFLFFALFFFLLHFSIFFFLVFLFLWSSSASKYEMILRAVWDQIPSDLFLLVKYSYIYLKGKNLPVSSSFWARMWWNSTIKHRTITITWLLQLVRIFIALIIYGRTLLPAHKETMSRYSRSWTCKGEREWNQ